MNPLFKFVTASMLVLAPTAIYAQSTEKPKHEIEVRGLFTAPSGEANFTANGITGDTVSFERDFDFKTEFGFEARYTYRHPEGRHKLLAGYETADWSRTRVLSRTITFAGQTYTANLEATGDLKLRVFRAMYAYRWGNEKFRFGPMGDIGIVSTNLSLTGTTNSGIRTSEGSRSKFAATVGYDLEYDPVPKVSIFHNLGAIAFMGDHLFHTEGGVKVYFTNNLGVTGGYKARRYKFDDDDRFLKIAAHGPFVGGVLRF